MNWRSLVILTVILVGLGAFYYFYDIEGAKKREELKTESQRLFSTLNASDVTKLSFERIPLLDSVENADEEAASYRLTFERNQDRWEISHPVRTKGDSTAINPLVEDVVKLKSDRWIKDVKDLSAYGLQKPAFVVEFVRRTLQGTEEMHQFRLGDSNPTKQFIYAVADESTSVALIPAALKDKLTKTLFDYRDKNVMEISQDDVNQLAYLCRGHPRIVLQRSEDSWKMLEPFEFSGDRTRINELIASLQSNKIKEFVAEAYDPSDTAVLAKYGFDSPWLEVSIRLTNPDSIQRLVVGNQTDEGGKFRYAFRDGFAPVLKIEDELIRKFDSNPFIVQNKDVCEFEREDVQKLVLATSDRQIVIERANEDSWQVVEPHRIPTDSTAVGSLLSDIAYLKASGLKPADAPLGEVETRVSLYGKDKTELISELIVGGKSQDGLGRYVESCKKGIFFQISDADAERFKKDEFSFRDKELIVFSKDQLKKITVTSEQRTVSFQPDGDSFKMVDSTLESLTPEKLEELFWELSRIKMKKIIEEPAEDFSKYGLDRPRFEITVTLKEKTLGPLLLGSETPEHDVIYSMLKSSKGVFGVEKADLNTLLHIDFKEKTKS